MEEKSNSYKKYNELHLPSFEKEILSYWDEESIFDKSISNRKDSKPYIFYEGPPSANGMPGIHHVISRTIKDLFCRYKTLKGYKVERKGGWDTHGLPVELQVEKELGISKEDIGDKITIAEYNSKCRKTVMKFKGEWDDLTVKMGFWLDLNNPYITFENDYIETLWYLLKKLYSDDLLYKGYTIQPYSPAAGTGLSSHELNLPGCYKNVKDTSIIAQFKVVNNSSSKQLLETLDKDLPVYFLAWTTTPWTLPSNSALAVGAKIDYVCALVEHPKTKVSQYIICASNILPSIAEGAKIIDESRHFKGKDLVGIEYEQLLDWVKPSKPAFRIITGDFVTTEDGTGIVHIAPTFGADDFKVAMQNDIPAITVKDENGNQCPLVDKRGCFVKEVTDFAGKYVRSEYEDEETLKDPDYRSTDVLIVIKLFNENKAWSKEKFEHSYPHCWRTDKPIIYYPMDSWFIKTTACKDKFVKRNKEINWKPKSTGKGRFETWLKNLVDWNLSRSRFWGTPLPIWRTVDGKEEICIGSVEELKQEVKKAVDAGLMKQPLPADFDLHRPYIDEVILVSPSGAEMMREPDLIDVWFDSGAMPYAQWHYPFENKETFEKNFPADFIAEGVDQTRGWFFTLHAIAVMISDSISYKNVVANGLVLDKDGNKMSKRLDNAVDPQETIGKYGADATRWYMVANAQPWDNIKFDTKGILEVQRKFFGTLFNIYSFFSLYANIDKFTYKEETIPVSNRPEIDRWIISLLNSLIITVNEYYSDYEPTKAARTIQEFTDKHLSNWYVRLCRRRFWKGEYSDDKISAYQTLYQCMQVISQLMSPIAPFFSDFLFLNLNSVTSKESYASVHLSDFPESESSSIDEGLEARMKIAQDISSLVLSLRKKVNIKVRQPLSKILVPILNEKDRDQIEKIRDLVLSEVNIKEIEYVTDTSGIFLKKIKPNFQLLGKKWGPKMKDISNLISAFDQKDIEKIENTGSFTIGLANEKIEILLEEVEISSEDIPGWQTETLDNLTVALDITLTEELIDEGNAREFINRIQNVRKDKGFEVIDRIQVHIQKNEEIQSAIINFKDYICSEILAEDIMVQEKVADATEINVNNKIIFVNIRKIKDTNGEKENKI